MDGFNHVAVIPEHLKLFHKQAWPVLQLLVRSLYLSSHPEAEL